LPRQVGKIDEGRIRMIARWRHSGFSTHRGNLITRDDREGREALCQYILRNAFSVERMTFVADVVSPLNRIDGRNELSCEEIAQKKPLAKRN
jgi:hypothetical protein